MVFGALLDAGLFQNLPHAAVLLEHFRVQPQGGLEAVVPARVVLTVEPCPAQVLVNNGGTTLAGRAPAMPAKTQTMMAAAPVMMLAVRPHAVGHRFAGVAGVVEALLDAAEQEDLVVHREPEQQAEEEQRHPGLDRVDLGQAEQVGADALLEDEHQEAVGGAHREQVHGDRRGRDHDRTEGHEQQARTTLSTTVKAIGSQHVEEGQVVDHEGGVARDVDLGGRATESGRHDGRADVLHGACVASPAGSPVRLWSRHREVAGLVDDGLRGAEAAVAAQGRFEARRRRA